MINRHPEKRKANYPDVDYMIRVNQENLLNYRKYFHKDTFEFLQLLIQSQETNNFQRIVSYFISYYTNISEQIQQKSGFGVELRILRDTVAIKLHALAENELSINHDDSVKSTADQLAEITTFLIQEYKEYHK